jgi:hypothetical protein
MSDTPLSEVCVCGGNQWHAMMDRVLWCRRCGCLRLILERYWRVPLDRVGELSTAVVLPDGYDDQPTHPGTPNAHEAENDEIEDIDEDDVND